MNIFLRELKANFKSLLIWSGIITLLIIIAVAKFIGGLTVSWGIIKQQAINVANVAANGRFTAHC